MSVLRAAIVVLHGFGVAVALLMAGLALVILALLVEALLGRERYIALDAVVFAIGYSATMLFLAWRTLREVRTSFRVHRRRWAAARARAPAPLPRARIVPR